MTMMCRGRRQARQRHTRGRAGERKATGMASGSGTGGRARAAWQHAGGTVRSGECHDLAGSVQLGRQRNTRGACEHGHGVETTQKWEDA
jgi:hypothetical protein